MTIRGVGAEPSVPAVEAYVRAEGYPFRTLASVKFIPGEIVRDRGLWSIPTKQLDTDAEAFVERFLRAFGAPPSHFDGLTAGAVNTRCVHLGYERSRQATSCRVYLEFDGAGSEIAAATHPRAGAITHVALKWDPRDGSGGRYSTYRWVDVSSLDAVGRAMRTYRERSPRSEAVRRLLSAHVGGREADRPSLLEVDEEGSARSSFDLGTRWFEGRTSELIGLVADLGSAFGQDESEMTPVLDAIRLHGRVERIAGGTGASGTDFATIYLGPGRSGH